MDNQTDTAKELALDNIIGTCVQIPGVKVIRDKFLAEIFATEDVHLQDILDFGPIKADFPREKLSAIANKHILIRTSQSSAASFVAGIPGGLAMAATIPADVLQFFGMALRLAQELSYLYGADDLWKDGKIDNDRVKSELIMYCGVMFGVSGAVSGVRVLSTQVAKTTLKKLPQKALTKTFWYPMVKQIGKALSISVTKKSVAQGISKVIPVIGGIISGSLNFASMLPMANRLKDTLDKASFDYSDEEMEVDIETIAGIADSDETENDQGGSTIDNVKKSAGDTMKKIGSGIAGIFSKEDKKDSFVEEKPSADEIINQIEKLSQLKEMGAITEEEFDAKKTELLAKI